MGADPPCAHSAGVEVAAIEVLDVLRRQDLTAGTDQSDRLRALGATGGGRPHNPIAERLTSQMNMLGSQVIGHVPDVCGEIVQSESADRAGTQPDTAVVVSDRGDALRSEFRRQRLELSCRSSVASRQYQDRLAVAECERLNGAISNADQVLMAVLGVPHHRQLYGTEAPSIAGTAW